MLYSFENKFFINGVSYDNQANAKVAYETANPVKSFEIEPDGSLVSLEDINIDITIKNSNGTSIRIMNEAAFINGNWNNIWAGYS